MAPKFAWCGEIEEALAEELREGYLAGHHGRQQHEILELLQNNNEEQLSYTYGNGGSLSWWIYVAIGLISIGKGSIAALKEPDSKPALSPFGEIKASGADIWKITKEMSAP